MRNYSRKKRLFLPAALIISGASFGLSQLSSAQTASSSNTPGSITAVVSGPTNNITQEGAARMGAADMLVRQGDALANKGDWKQAEVCYRAAMVENPNDFFALCRLSHHAFQSGDTATALSCYRVMFYSAGSFQGGSLREEGEYAILLSQTGQMAEAIPVYNELVRFLDYSAEGTPMLKLLLPIYSSSSKPFSIEEFQAMAHVGAAMNDPDDADKLAHLQAAAKLYPASGIADYYLGEYLKTQPGREAEAIKAFQIARDNGGPQMEASVDQAVKTGSWTFVEAAKKVFGN